MNGRSRPSHGCDLRLATGTVCDISDGAATSCRALSAIFLKKNLEPTAEAAVAGIGEGAASVVGVALNGIFAWQERACKS